ncbi:MAG: hypothetical protein H6Q15_843 [Bacteroidetes bacterium]|nr:hypothetical protein [Bacteroidota bacterium]
MKKTFRLLFFILPLFILSCTNEEEVGTGSSSSLKSTGSNDEIILGVHYPNPYSLTNMLASYNDLVNTGQIGGNFQVQLTDLYVRFLPSDSTQLNFLNESGLELFDYPMDYEIVKEGTYYHDPSIPADQITWLYTTVPAGYNFNQSITYQILDSCFIPVDNSEDKIASEYDILEQHSFARLGLLEIFRPEESDAKGWFTGYRPKGIFKVEDSEITTPGLVPVKGVKVKCNIIVKWASAYTNANGEYTMNRKFSINPLYSVRFVNNRDFTIWTHFNPFCPALHFIGKKSRKGYNINIYKTSCVWDLATINNAAYEYYENLCTGANAITAPPSKLKILAVRGHDASCAGMFRRIDHLLYFNGNSSFGDFMVNFFAAVPTNLLFHLAKYALPDIIIGTGTNSSHIISEDTYHELAHASHFSKVGSDFWADYINYIITYGAYGSQSSNKSGICGVGEMWGFGIGYMNGYEKYNTIPILSGEWFSPNIVSDLIIGGVLTKKQIFDCLEYQINSHQKLKEKLILAYPTKSAEISEIFSIHEF